LENIYSSIEMLSKEKGIDTQIVLDAVKDALLIAARKHFRTTEDLIAELEERTGSIRLFAVKKAVETVEDPVKEMTLSEARRIDPAAEAGSEIRISKPTEGLGRIAAQTAKQVIFQKVREAERDTIYQEYSGRAGELVNCVIKRVEGPDLVADLGKTEARLPKKEQSRLENHSVGDRVRCVIKLVDKSSKGPGVLVSRADPELVKRLFEQEVPEIYDNTVLIKGCAREAGERTKIAVWSRDRDVDCVGACVGMKGMRVQSIIRELRGEKIDIIEWSEDPVSFATHALSPAKISRVTVIDALGKHMEVIVDDSQLSLAIGKKGQNVRLAAKLLGWKIDIKSEEEKRQEVEFQMEALAQGSPLSILIEYGLPEHIADKLAGGGVGTVEKLGDMTPEQLEEIPGIDAETVEAIQTAVNGYYGQYASEDAGDAPEEGAQESGPTDADLAAIEADPTLENAQFDESGALDVPGSEAEPDQADVGSHADHVEDESFAPAASPEASAEDFVTMVDAEGTGLQGAEGDVSGPTSQATNPQA
jgi:N utilization substance protein A